MLPSSSLLEMTLLCVSDVHLLWHCFLSLSAALNDFHEVTMDLTFTPDGEMSRVLCVNITVVNDDILEDTEIFSVTISTFDDSVMFKRNTSNVFIIDDEGMYTLQSLLVELYFFLWQFFKSTWNRVHMYLLKEVWLSFVLHMKKHT